MSARSRADAVRWALRHWQAPEHASVAIEAVGPLKGAQLAGLEDGDIHGELGGTAAVPARSAATSSACVRCLG